MNALLKFLFILKGLCGSSPAFVEITISLFLFLLINFPNLFSESLFPYKLDVS